MIKCVIQCGDIHIRPYLRLDEYAEQLEKFVSMATEVAKGYEKDEVRIVLCGDIVHSKLTISNELMVFCSTFIRKLENIARVLVFTGNHDLTMNNESRKDTLSGLFETASFQNSYLLDKLLSYESGCIVDDNITWALYSIHDGYRRPNIEDMRKSNPPNTVVGLYHGSIVGAMLDNGTSMDSGLEPRVFTNCDIVMAGDIHKRQVIEKGNTRVVYCGSLIQQTFGETVSQHGFVVWDMENLEYKFYDLESDYSMYMFEINDQNDFENSKEVLVNA